MWQQIKQISQYSSPCCIGIHCCDILVTGIGLLVPASEIGQPVVLTAEAAHTRYGIQTDSHFFICKADKFFVHIYCRNPPYNLLYIMHIQIIDTIGVRKPFNPLFHAIQNPHTVLNLSPFVVIGHNGVLSDAVKVGYSFHNVKNFVYFIF